MEAALARDDQGKAFELPEEAVYWRVRRQTSGRPKTVLGSDGEPLHIPIQGGTVEMEDNDCEPGRYRLEATDANRQPLRGVPIAVVDLGGRALERAPARAELVPTSSEPAQTTTEALTRTVESMQRTQLESERHSAERERWQMQAMVESQRAMALICTSLIERIKPASTVAASNPLTILKQQAEANQVIDQLVDRRNAGALPLPDAAPTADSNEGQGILASVLTGMLSPIAPSVNQFIQSQTLRMLGLTPDQIVAQLGGSSIGVQSGAPRAADSDDQAAAITYPRSLRQVLGELNDDEASMLEDAIGALGDNERQALFAEATTIEDTDERVEWLRALMRQKKNTHEEPAPVAASIPAPLIPLFQRLTTAEQQTAARMLSRLDLAALKELGAALLPLGVEAQLAKVKQMIATFEQREASTAQRAVFSVLRSEAA